jgi:hypothetical protein
LVRRAFTCLDPPFPSISAHEFDHGLCMEMFPGRFVGLFESLWVGQQLTISRSHLFRADREIAMLPTIIGRNIAAAFPLRKMEAKCVS